VGAHECMTTSNVRPCLEWSGSRLCVHPKQLLLCSSAMCAIAAARSGPADHFQWVFRQTSDAVESSRVCQTAVVRRALKHSLTMQQLQRACNCQNDKLHLCAQRHR
jgi:hypothetical protein